VEETEEAAVIIEEVGMPVVAETEGVVEETNFSGYNKIVDKLVNG